MLAARPKTLTGAAVPVMLGCALAASDGDFHLLPAVLCLLFAFLMQLDASLVNDLWDYLKGSDGKDRLGPERACAQGWSTPRAMRRGIALTTAAACITGCGLLFYGGWWLIAVGALCVVFAFLYTAGPYPLAYHGWGDLLVLAFFGIVPVGCTCYILGGSWTWQTGVISAACGLAIDTLLMVNNYRDREQDARSGKRTLVVRLGARAAVRPQDRRMRDIGTGTGLIALMLAQRSAARITAVDVDAECATQAAENFAASPWADRLDAVAVAVQRYDPVERFDLIVSNPPYYVDSLLSPDEGRNTARHAAGLPFGELAAAVVRLLAPGGRFALVLPPVEMQRFRSAALGRLYPVRWTEGYSTPRRGVRRILAEFCTTPVPPPEPSRLVIELGGSDSYTEDYRRLTGDFYLKF